MRKPSLHSKEEHNTYEKTKKSHFRPEEDDYHTIYN